MYDLIDPRLSYEYEIYTLTSTLLFHQRLREREGDTDNLVVICVSAYLLLDYVYAI